MADFLKTVLNIIGILLAFYFILVVSVLISVGGIMTAVALMEWIIGGFL